MPLAGTAVGRRTRGASARLDRPGRHRDGGPEPVSAPSTLAVGVLDGAGDADYRFYLDGTSAGQLSEQDIPPGLAAGSNALVLGGLGLLLEPMASTLVALVTQLDGDALLVLDPNCRPGAIGDIDAHRALIERLCERADVVKVSAHDLAVLAPQAGAREGARALLARGARAVLLTDGPAPVSIHCGGEEAIVPVPDVTVADTVGGGDAFVGAFTAWWSGRGLGREEVEMPVLERAVAEAVRVAALTCASTGAQPPRIEGWLRLGGSGRCAGGDVSLECGGVDEELAGEHPDHARELFVFLRPPLVQQVREAPFAGVGEPVECRAALRGELTCLLGLARGREQAVGQQALARVLQRRDVHARALRQRREVERAAVRCCGRAASMRREAGPPPRGPPPVRRSRARPRAGRGGRSC